MHLTPFRFTLPRAALATLFLALAAEPAAAAELTLPRPSPKSTLTQTVGLSEITVIYSRPGVKGRTMWGELVPYGKVWRTGANETTSITFSQDVEVAGQKLAAGRYGLHTIPTATEWTVIFNTDAEQWGSYTYKSESDALRIQVKPQAVPHHEWLTFSFPTLSTEATELMLAWEKTAIVIPIKTASIEASLAAIDKALTATKAEAWRIPYRAADFCFTNDVRLDQAMTWIDQSMAAETTYQNTQLKAKLLARSGDRAAALAMAEKAMAIARAKPDSADTAPLERLVSEWKAAK